MASMCVCCNLVMCHVDDGQVATGSGLMSHFVHLRIVTPKAYIQGSSGEHHVDMGSVIRLVCVIEKVP